MGCNQSTATEAEKKANRAHNAKIKSDKNKEKDVVKLLLLGAGESGKSTIFKQMKVIHKDGYTDDEFKSFIPTVHNNCLNNMRDLISGAELLGIQFDPESMKDADRIALLENNTVLTLELAETVMRVWESAAGQEAYQQRNKFQLHDSTAYFAQDAMRIAQGTYQPTTADILHTRVRTTGINDMSFLVDDVEFRIYDVGGQRSERRKWIHCFENVTAVMFVAAISEYDQKLFEDGKTNRVLEAVTIFEEICNSHYFSKTAMILFLNKRDLFEKKIKEVDLNVCFPDYQGGLDYDAAVKFLTGKFTAQLQDPDKTIYTHVTCATDTGNVQFVFNAVKDIILTSNIMGSGML